MSLFSLISGKSKQQPMVTDFDSGNVAGKILISTPNMDGSSCFDKSVIFVLSHDYNGTLGVIINRVISSLNVSIVFKSLQIKCPDLIGKNPLHFGGPVESEKGLILHTGDYQKDVLLKINDNLMLSSNSDILKNIASGDGPKNSLLLLGYAGWAAGQLESEIRNGRWITTDFSNELIFSKDNYNKYNQALMSIGIRPGTMVPGFGTA